MPRPQRLSSALRTYMLAVSKTNRPFYVYELQAKVGIAHPTAIGINHRLERDGLIRRTEQPVDAPPAKAGKPRVWFELTEDGKTVANEIREESLSLQRKHAAADLGLDFGLH